MNLKKKFRAFFTLTRKADGGFTLVELIVVIAILAILSGVAVPAYSGYVKKAERAADEALLNEINTAFASACMINGENNYYRNDVDAGISGKKFVYTEPFADAFSSFFESEDAEFKVIQNLLYDLEFGGFKDPLTAETLVLAYGDGYVQVTGEAINALLNSTYYGEGMDSEKLLNQVDNVAGVAGLMGTIQNVMQTEGFVNAALSSLGITPGTDPQANAELLEKKAQELALKKMGLTDISQITEENKAEYGEYLKDINNNALVLYTAQSTSQMTTEEAKGLLNDVTSTMIKDAMDGKLEDVDEAKGMNQAALAYGMYYAYVNSDQCTDESIKGKTDIGAPDVIAALDSGEDSEFRKYMNSDQGTKDMEAYLQALSVINSGTQSPEAVEKLVSEGFASDDLLGILQGTMGK